jgi:hypothetical protein
VSLLRACSSDENMITMANERRLPPDERSFLQAISDYGGSKFIYSKPLEAVPLRRQRAAAIGAAVPHGIVSNWVGRVEEVSATNCGDVPENSPIYAEISKLEENELVRISGSFQPSQSDCFRTSGSGGSGSNEPKVRLGTSGGLVC